MQRSQNLRNFVRDDIEAFLIWRRRIESRVEALEQAIRGWHLLQASPQSIRGERDYLRPLNQFFDEEEVREIAFAVGVDFDALIGESKRGKVLSLVQEMDRQNRLDQLHNEVRKRRPNVDWPPFV